MPLVCTAGVLTLDFELSVPDPQAPLFLCGTHGFPYEVVVAYGTRYLDTGGLSAHPPPGCWEANA